ncbi:MAG TPA: hypothetical protein VFG66_10105 [Gemmatimonadales bacterium]|nr:hypothetical protein [Gemmatimonadales bacterium]
MGPVSFAMSAMGSAVAFGLAIVSATVLGVDVLRPATLPADPAVGSPFYLLVFGTIAGLLLAGVVAWHLLAPILSIYRRGGLSVVSAFATVLAMLLCIPVHQLAGRTGLGALIALALLVSLLLARRARRLVGVP